MVEAACGSLGNGSDTADRHGNSGSLPGSRAHWGSLCLSLGNGKDGKGGFVMLELGGVT